MSEQGTPSDTTRWGSKTPREPTGRPHAAPGTDPRQAGAAPSIAGAVSGATCLLALLLMWYGGTGWGVGFACAFTSWICACLYYVGTVGPFSLPLLYLAVLGLFHLPLVPLVALGVEIPVDDKWVLTDSVGRALLLFAVACGCMVVGSTVQRVIGTAGREEPRMGHNPVLLQSGIVLWVAAVVMLGVGAWQLNLFTANYAEFWAMDADPRLFGTGILFALLASILVAVGAPARWTPLGAGVFLAVLMPIVIFGFRGQVIVYCIAAIPLWHLKRPVFARRAATAALIAVVVGSPIIRVTRGRSDVTFAEALQEATPISFLAETGYSLRALSETIILIDSHATDLWMGSSYLEAGTRIFPNVGSERAAVQTVPTAPAQYLVYAIEPWLWKRGFGYGYSAVAEPYLNFGITGVIGYFALLGMGLSYANSIMGRSAYVTAWVGCAFGSLLWTARNDFTNLVRPAVWSAAILAAAYVVQTSSSAIRRLAARASGPQPPADPGDVASGLPLTAGPPTPLPRRRWGQVRRAE